MTIPAILSLATGTPPNQYRQMDIHDQWISPFLHTQRARAIFTAAEIDTRFSALADAAFLSNEPSTKARNDVYMQTARPLAQTVIRQALARANLAPTDLDHFIVISCTGFDDPGLDVLLAGDLHMRPDLRRSALIGMGCHAGLTGLDRAVLELAARPQSHVLVLTVELGTLHFQHGKKLDSMIAAALFGDGAAAVIVGPHTSPGRPKLLDTMTYSDYQAHDLLGFRVSDKGYEIRLDRNVPQALQNIVPNLVAGFLKRSNLNKDDIRFWGIHPGGAKIVDYLAQGLDLRPDEVNFSRQVLRQYGNMSSATIFFVLDQIIRQGQPQPGDYALLQSFGPGLTIELCLVQW
ncbi:MAG: type III polyketide synthase [Anaerolineae bacterium]|nr:type III polyketide synthase [Anaerolineae bacterium]